MAIKEDKNNPKRFIVSYSKRHPITRHPVSLRRKGIASRAEAKRIEAMLIVEVEERLRASKFPTWARTVENLVEEMRNRGLSERTIENYELALRAHTIGEWGERLVDTITTSEIRDLVLRKTAKTSVGNRQNVLKHIRAAFQCAVDLGHLKANPVPQMRMKSNDRVKRVLTESQVTTFLNRAREEAAEWYPVWAMAVYTGMRSGELYALRWDQVNFETRQIIVDTAWNSKDGFKGTKSGHERIISFNDTVAYILRELKLARGSSDFVLPRHSKWDKGDQARELQKFLIGIGLPPIKFHDLRATWATLMLSKGVEPVKVMKLGGWRDMKTMMIYVRMAGIDTKGATDCLVLHNPVTNPAAVVNFYRP